MLPVLADSPMLLLLLFGTGLLAGFTDSIAGGGGLLTVPVLLAAGLPPQVALATNKLQSSFGSVTASTVYLRKGVVSFKGLRPAILLVILGASAGTLLVQRLDGSLLRSMIPWLLLAVFLFFLFRPRLGLVESRSRLSLYPLLLVFAPLLGFYDGFLGPGTGSFWTFALVLLGGLELRRATGLTKVLNMTSNLVALFWFLLGGQVWFAGGLVMGAGQLLGARLGAGLVVRRGAGFVRPVFLVVVFLTLIKLWSSN
ncbi:MAG: TSUP family transporter [Calditrichaeota bacterium]|nr:TSUP family transporter [Candidatus Cloacimonadota bacterium]MCB1047986.1 TSUP family transporter [Calditrichota bacterium]